MRESSEFTQILTNDDLAIPSGAKAGGRGGQGDARAAGGKGGQSKGRDGAAAEPVVGRANNSKRGAQSQPGARNEKAGAGAAATAAATAAVSGPAGHRADGRPGPDGKPVTRGGGADGRRTGDRRTAAGADDRLPTGAGSRGCDPPTRHVEVYFNPNVAPENVLSAVTTSSRHFGEFFYRKKAMALQVRWGGVGSGPGSGLR